MLPWASLRIRFILRSFCLHPHLPGVARPSFHLALPTYNPLLYASNITAVVPLTGRTVAVRKKRYYIVSCTVSAQYKCDRYRRLLPVITRSTESFPASVYWCERDKGSLP